MILINGVLSGASKKAKPAVESVPPKIHVSISKDEFMGLKGGEKISCRDVAKFALNVLYNNEYFLINRGIWANYRADVNGGGTQIIYIERKDGFSTREILMEIWCSSTFADENFLYEADKITDGHKDYHPTINQGKHRFDVERSRVYFDWSSDEAVQWRSEIMGFSMYPENLSDWLDEKLEMSVRCSNKPFCCDNKNTVSKSLIEYYAAEGYSFEDFTKRLKCSKCLTGFGIVAAYRTCK